MIGIDTRRKMLHLFTVLEKKSGCWMQYISMCKSLDPWATPLYRASRKCSTKVEYIEKQSRLSKFGELEGNHYSLDCHYSKISLIWEECHVIARVGWPSIFFWDNDFMEMQANHRKQWAIFMKAKGREWASL